jgi:hypothetical protein
MALAITSFPVPVSPWIKTAESTGATLATSVSNARNFGLDPIKSKVVIALFLYEYEICSAFPLIVGKPPPWIRLTNHDLLATKPYVFKAQ